MDSCAHVFLEESGGKRVVNKSACIILFWTVAIFFAAKKVFQARPTSSSSGLAVSKESPHTPEAAPPIPPYRRPAPVYKKRKFKQKKTSTDNIRYRAPQVINRGDGGTSTALPLGASAIGRLLGNINTEALSGLVRVALPYGLSFQGKRRVPRKSVLFGRVSYPGKGEKVFITFHRGISPDGKEFPIKAHALDPKDFSPGVRGKHHGNTGLRAMGTLGLSVLGVMGNVLIEKEALGGSRVVTPKSTLKNAAMSGLAKAAEEEGGRRASEVRERREYVTLAAGQDLIVSVLGREGN